MKAMRILMLAVVLICSAVTNAISATKTASEQLFDRANTKYYSENYPEALDIYTKALEAASKEGNDSIYIRCTGYIGNIYDVFSDYNSCLFYYLKGYAAAKRVGNDMLRASFLTNIVTCYTRLGNVEQAKAYYKMLGAIPSGRLDKQNNYFVIYGKARILAAEHSYDAALCEHRKAMAFARHNNMDSIYVLYQLSEIGNLYVRMGKDREALAVGDACVAMSKVVGSRELMVNAYKMLADAYTQMQLADSARCYREKYFDLNDSVYNISKFYNARFKLSEYENREHERQVSRLNERIMLQVYAIVAVAFFLVLIAVFSYIIYRKNRHLTQTQRLLIERNKDLEARERQNRQLLQQYLEQMGKNGMGNTVAVGGKDTDAPTEPLENAALCRDADQKALTSEEHDDMLEKQLLSLINDAMSDIKVISNPDFSLQMLADMVGSNTNYVSRVINNSYQKNFKTLLNERRIREACHKLSDRKQYAGYTMQVIYEEVGYKNASSFIRAFKKIYNMTPSEFQRLSDGE